MTVLTTSSSLTSLTMSSQLSIVQGHYSSFSSSANSLNSHRMTTTQLCLCYCIS
ncbi:hypothetical protein BgiMline_033337, partial [Biomphalaria glabrata]